MEVAGGVQRIGDEKPAARLARNGIRPWLGRGANAVLALGVPGDLGMLRGEGRKLLGAGQASLHPALYYRHHRLSLLR